MGRNLPAHYSQIVEQRADCLASVQERRVPTENGDRMSIRSRTDKDPVRIEEIIRPNDADLMEPLGKQEPRALRPHLGRGKIESGRSRLEQVLGWLAGSLTVCAVLASALLLVADASPNLVALFRLLVALALKAWVWLGHAPLSALPLLLAGTSYMALQALLRPEPAELVRRLMLGAAFLLWGIVQLMPPSGLATDLGDLVIALYVLDLGLMVQAELQRA